jgi:hypothetical protein
MPYASAHMTSTSPFATAWPQNNVAYAQVGVPSAKVSAANAAAGSEDVSAKTSHASAPAPAAVASALVPTVPTKESAAIAGES